MRFFQHCLAVVTVLTPASRNSSRLVYWFSVQWQTTIPSLRGSLAP
jgi:hypothetical protein